MAETSAVPETESRREYLARTFRTFVAVCWLVSVAIVLGASLLGISRLRSIPTVVTVLAVPAAILVSALVTGWLVDGGYERLGANPNAAGRFGWLAFAYAPISFVPTQLALDAAGIAPAGGFAIAVVAAIFLAGWLTVFGGFDRLDIETRHVAHAAGVAVGLSVVGVLVGPHVVPGLSLTPGGTAIAALAAQVAALWLGFGGYVDRILASGADCGSW